MSAPDKRTSRWSRWAPIAVAMVVAHLAIWIAIGRTRGEPLEIVLRHFDASYYSLIVGEGYVAGELREVGVWGFNPLYPLAVRVVAWLSGAWAWQATLGAALSTACLAAACRVAEGIRARDPGGAAAGVLYPRTRWGWFVLLLSPASFALHSHHTEGMFLLLSLGAFAAAARDRPVLAAALAGLSALNRTQGVLVAVCVGLWAASRQRGLRAVGALATTALVAGAIYAPWPLYQWHATGNPRISMVRSQMRWGYPVPVKRMIDRWLLREPGQEADVGTLARYAALVAALGTAVAIARRHRIIGLYLVVSLLLNPLRGEPTHGSLRYLAVLFPILFTWGDALAQVSRRRSPAVARALEVAAVVAIVAANLKLTADYAWGTDPY